MRISCIDLTGMSTSHFLLVQGNKFNSAQELTVTKNCTLLLFSSCDMQKRERRMPNKTYARGSTASDAVVVPDTYIRISNVMSPLLLLCAQCPTSAVPLGR